MLHHSARRRIVVLLPRIEGAAGLGEMRLGFDEPSRIFFRAVWQFVDLREGS